VYVTVDPARRAAGVKVPASHIAVAVAVAVAVGALVTVAGVTFDPAAVALSAHCVPFGVVPFGGVREKEKLAISPGVIDRWKVITQFDPEIVDVAGIRSAHSGPTATLRVQSEGLVAPGTPRSGGIGMVTLTPSQVDPIVPEQDTETEYRNDVPEGCENGASNVIVTSSASSAANAGDDAIPPVTSANNVTAAMRNTDRIVMGKLHRVVGSSAFLTAAARLKPGQRQTLARRDRQVGLVAIFN
jgi:hypothetical protein